MAGSGKAKYLAGLQSLVQGFTAMDERRRQRLLDNLEREKFKYEKSLDVGAAQERRENRILGIREKQFDRMIDMGKIRQADEENRRKHILGSRDKAFSRMLGIGRLNATEGNLAAREAALELARQREGRIASDIGGGGSSSGPMLGGPSKGSKLRAETIDLSREIAAEKPMAINLDKLLSANRSFQPLEPEAAPAERFMPEASRYTGASDIKVPSAASAATSDIGWIRKVEDAVNQEIFSIAQDDEETGFGLAQAIKSTPAYQDLLTLSPEQRADALVRLKTGGLRYFGLGE